MAQPAVSRTLSMLEKRLGEPLFLKGRRPLQPTPLGRALADHGQVMLAASRKASDTIESFRVGKGGTVRVGGTPFFMDALISNMIAEPSRTSIRMCASTRSTAISADLQGGAEGGPDRPRHLPHRHPRRGVGAGIPARSCPAATSSPAASRIRCC
jgi:DNA-binding transcriptional LysR family regulator